MVPLDGAASAGGATGEGVLECAADLRQQPPPQGWEPLNSSGAAMACSVLGGTPVRLFNQIAEPGHVLHACQRFKLCYRLHENIPQC